MKTWGTDHSEQVTTALMTNSEWLCCHQKARSGSKVNVFCKVLSSYSVWWAAAGPTSPSFLSLWVCMLKRRCRCPRWSDKNFLLRRIYFFFRVDHGWWQWNIECLRYLCRCFPSLLMLYSSMTVAVCSDIPASVSFSEVSTQRDGDTRVSQILDNVDVIRYISIFFWVRSDD